MFSEQQKEFLGRALDGERVKARKQAGRQVQYLEGYDVIDRANAIFGFDGWSYAVLDTAFVRMGEVGFYQATVRVWIGDTERTDVGVGDVAFPRDRGLDGANADAFGTALKGAVTDGLKRALRTFGSQFGNSLYDKEDHTHDGEEPAALAPKRTTAAGPTAKGPQADGGWSDTSTAFDERDPHAWLSLVLTILGNRGYEKEQAVIWAKAWMQREVGVEKSALMTVAQWRQLRVAALKLPPAAKAS